MKLVTLAKYFSRLVMTCGLLVLNARLANALTLNYSFTMNSNGFSAAFVTANTSQSRFFHGGGTINVSYDTVTEVLLLTANSTGNIFGATPTNDLDFGNILVSNVLASANITLTHVVPGINAGGLVALTANSSTGTGTFSFSDLGLGNGVTTFPVMSMPMTGADFASLPAANSDYADLLGLGEGLYWQFLVTSPLSSLFGQTASFSWYNGTNDLVINGINFGHPHTDLLGSSVPEPGTLLLLGFGLAGAAAARRKSA